jgi:hypothetical protein
MDEDELVSALRQLVVDGEYLDDIPGVPGARLEGGGMYRGDRRMYHRGSPEFVAARAEGLIERLPRLRPPASIRAVEQAEALIDRPLPPLLRRLYLEVGNGGFGPGYGILGVKDGHGDDYRRNATDLYEAWREGWLAGREQLFHVSYWGCAIYSLVDCSSHDATMWGWDPNPVPDDDVPKALFIESMTLNSWLERWIDGRLNQPAVLEDPSTGEWRGATDQDWSQWSAEAQT